VFLILVAMFKISIPRAALDTLQRCPLFHIPPVTSYLAPHVFSTTLFTFMERTSALVVGSVSGILNLWNVHVLSQVGMVFVYVSHNTPF